MGGEEIGGNYQYIYIGRDLNEGNFSRIINKNHKYPVYSNTVENKGLYGYYDYCEYNGKSLTIVGRGVGLGTAFPRQGGYSAIGRLLVLFPKNNENEIYISEYINSRLNIFQESSGIPQLTGEQIAKYRIPLPPLPEQKRIAEVLSTWDQAIQCTEQLIRQKEQRKKWLMQKLLTGKIRLKGFSGEWKEYSYERLLKVVKRPVKWDDNQLYKLISVRRRSGGIFFREALFGRQIKVKDLRDLKVGDFLFSKMQIVHGASALVTKEFEGGKISGSYIATVARDSNILNMEFFNWYSRLPYFYHQTLISSYGVHIEKMTFDFESFLQLKMNLPSIEEQTAIAEVLQAADKEIELLKAKADKLKEQKKGLMQQLLTGRKRLNLNLQD